MPDLRRCSVFDQREFRTWVGLAKVYLIHEGADEEDPAAGAAQDVFGSQRVGKAVRVEARALVGNLDEQIVHRGFEGDGDVFAGVVGVAVQDGVDDGLADGHGDVAAGVLIEADALGVVLGCLFRLIHTGERGR